MVLNETTNKYVPLYKRNTNIFRGSNTFKSQKERVNNFEISNNLFPSLNNKTGDTEKIMNPVINYADIAKKRQEEEIQDTNDPGWMYIHKDRTIKYKKSNRFDSVYRLLQEIQENKFNNAVNSILDRYEYEEMMDLELNGPKYVYGWELDRVLDTEKKNWEEDNQSDEDEDANEYYNDGNIM